MIAAASAVRPPGVGDVLGRAVRDFYEESWRLVILNSLLSAYVLAVLAAVAFVPAAVVLLFGAGPLLAALVSAAAVVIVESGSLTFLDVAEGFRHSWSRGLVLGASLALGALATVFALRFYGSVGPLAWPLAVLVLYLGAVYLLFQLLLWPIALRDPGRPLREAAAAAGLRLLGRPVATTGLGLALLAVNVLGIVAAVLPFLTMTIAYSALAAARFALASSVEEA